MKQVADDLIYPPRVLSGVQPTLGVHLGHYFGALKQHIELHHQYPGQAFYLIADYHTLTRCKDAAIVRQGTIELATTYLALGLDPNKATLFRQSDVPECTELAWILSCSATTGEVLRIPTFKDAMKDVQDKEKSTASVGLLYYPILMAADIFSVRATIIPVGNDQRPNVEMARVIARRFNAVYKTDFFPIPELRVNEFHTVPGIDGRKMSHGYDNHILLFERFDELQKKVRKIMTDSKSKYEPKNPDNCIIFSLYSLVAPPERVASMRRRYEEGAIGYDDAKRDLTLAIQEFFSAFQDRYDKLKREPDFVADVLREGFKQASQEAQYTLDNVRHLVGLTSS